MPVTKEVMAEEVIRPLTSLRRFLAHLYMARAAPGRPNIMTTKNMDRNRPAVGSPARKRVISPVMTVPSAWV